MEIGIEMANTSMVKTSDAKTFFISLSITIQMVIA